MPRTFLILFLLVGILPAFGDDVTLRICNEGDVPVYVALAEVKGIPLDDRLISWYTIEPGNGSNGKCPSFAIGTTYARYYHFAFAQRDPKGRLGIVMRPPARVDKKMDPVWYCLASKGHVWTDTTKALQTCDGDEKLAPFSMTLELVGTRGNGDFTYTVVPHATDPIELYLDDVDIEKERLEAMKAAAQNLGGQRRWSEAVTAQKAFMAAFLPDADADAFGSLSWYQLHVRDFKGALESSAVSLSLSNVPRQQLMAQTNLAHALLLTGSIEAARTLYERNRGKEVGGLKWDVAILDDFNSLEKEGITHPEMNRFRSRAK